jgi:hypothetical protein
MKTQFTKKAQISVVGLLLLASVEVCHAQENFSLRWFKVAGTGTSTNSQYSLSGTIGQAEAGGTMSGGNFSLTGGFWSLIAPVPTPGAPTLLIRRFGSQVTVYWQNTGTWTLQQNSNLNLPAGWVASSGVVTANGTNSLTLNAPSGNLFFRLKP